MKQSAHSKISQIMYPLSQLLLTMHHSGWSSWSLSLSVSVPWSDGSVSSWRSGKKSVARNSTSHKQQVVLSSQRSLSVLPPISDSLYRRHISCHRVSLVRAHTSTVAMVSSSIRSKISSWRGYSLFLSRSSVQVWYFSYFTGYSYSIFIRGILRYLEDFLCMGKIKLRARHFSCIFHFSDTIPFWLAIFY